MKASTLATTVIIGGAIVAALPWANGLLAERNYHQIVSRANVTAQGQWTVVALDYQRGYRSSVALSRVTLPPGSIGSEAVVFELETRVEHAWHGARTDTRLARTGELGEALQELFGDHDPLRLVTWNGVLGPAEASLHLDPAELQPEPEMRLVMLPGRFDLSPSADGSAALGITGAWQGLNLSAQTGEQLALDGLTLNGTLEGSRFNGEWRLDTLRFDDAGAPVFVLRGLTHAYTRTEKGQRFDAVNDLRADQIEIGTYRATDLRVDASAEGVDSAALARVEQALIAAGGELPSAQQELQDATLALLGGGLGLRLYQDAGLAGYGAWQLRFSAQVQPFDPRGVGAGDPSAVLDALSAELYVSVPVSLLESDPTLEAGAVAMLEQGWARVDGDSVVIDARYAQRGLTAHGQSVPLPF